MSKFSSFERIDKDFYGTIDPKAVPPNFLKYVSGMEYAEPCYGAGDLEKLLGDAATCVFASDLREETECLTLDGLELTEEDLKACDLIVTNPPYKKDILLPLLEHWRKLKPTWVLLPSDVMHNRYMSDLMKYCSRVVSVGRLYWFENTWVVKEPFDYDDLGLEWDKYIEFYDSMKGIKYYTGYLTNQGKPCKTKFVRGTDNYCWYRFGNAKLPTLFETRGD